MVELNLKEKILGGTFLHNDEMVALSQATGTFVYDNRGIELHRLPQSMGL